MNRAIGSELAGMRLAFWGYTNRLDACATLDLARQLRRCEDALSGRANINRFFYEMPVAVDGRVAQAVRDVGGPSHCDGGWDALAAALPAVGRGFEAIICTSVDRISRSASRFFLREQLASAHDVALLTADESTLELCFAPVSDVATFCRAVRCTSG